SERERTVIRAQLLAKGRELFATQGIKKANVEDLTKAANISKGAFYQFYDSKEALFFELLGQFEDEYHAGLLEAAARPGASPRQQVKDVLMQAFTIWRTNPLFTNFNQEEFEYLARKLPEELMQANLNKDEVFVARLLGLWREQGVTIDCEPSLFLGLMRALFFMSLHRDDLGPGMYPGVFAFFVDAVAQQIVRE
ncbi:MAG TPA: TetR/AcrR family transcriptional regulator, partial [Roseiflexaceae bacterium]|nr:TetR/AcrR family transcriptional regulator [Roseiflexaceae bacterium]